jgi:hypothetical protein
VRRLGRADRCPSAAARAQAPSVNWP